MSRLVRSDDEMWSVDDLEIELRMLPGVRAAGFDTSDDMVFVQLHVAEGTRGERAASAGDEPPMPVTASRIAARHSDRPVTVEVVRWRDAPAPPAALGAAPSSSGSSSDVGDAVSTAATAADTPGSGDAGPDATVPRRARLLAVLAFPDTDELEVHLVLDGRRTIGRAAASEGVEGAASATIDAIRELGTGVDAQLLWARAIDDPSDTDRVVVAVALEGVDPRAAVNFGVAGGASNIDAASRATLDALDRRLSRPR